MWTQKSWPWDYRHFKDCCIVQIMCPGFILACLFQRGSILAICLNVKVLGWGPFLYYFYASVFKTWGMFRVSRLNNEHHSIAEPILYSSLLKVQLLSSNSVADTFLKAGVTKWYGLIDPTAGQWRPPQVSSFRSGWSDVSQAYWGVLELTCLKLEETQLIMRWWWSAWCSASGVSRATGNTSKYGDGGLHRVLVVA